MPSRGSANGADTIAVVWSKASSVVVSVERLAEPLSAQGQGGINADSIDVGDSATSSALNQVMQILRGSNSDPTAPPGRVDWASTRRETHKLLNGFSERPKSY